MSRETKALPLTELKFGDTGSGSFAGYASIFGTVDAYGDVVENGAYKATLPDFLTHGFIAWSHDYTSLPIAIPISAKEDSRGLWVEAQFHSDEFAQRARRIAAERAAAGKSVGLSIGYSATKSDRDEAGLRHLKQIDLYETSLVMLPANRDAGIVGIKATPDPELKPYGIRREGDEYCVYNTDTDERAPGGCHPTREAALRHQRALMANVEDADHADQVEAKESPTCKHLFDFDVPFAELLVQLGGWTEYGASEAEALLSRRAAEERKLRPEHLQAISDYLAKAEAARVRLERLIAEPANGKGGLGFALELRRRRLQALEAP